MNTSNLITIPYVEGDEIIHREANGYRCSSDPTCPCREQAPAPGYTDEEKAVLDELAQEQADAGANFLYWSTDNE